MYDLYGFARKQTTLSLSLALSWNLVHLTTLKSYVHIRTRIAVT